MKCGCNHFCGRWSLEDVNACASDIFNFGNAFGNSVLINANDYYGATENAEDNENFADCIHPNNKTWKWKC